MSARNGSGRIRVALFSPSPIPYKVPLFRRLAALEDLDLTVIYASTMGISPSTAGYRENVVWDRDLADGYRVEFLKKADRNGPKSFSSTELIDFDIVPWLLRERYDVLFCEGYAWFTHQMAMITQRAWGGGVVMRDSATMLHPRSLAKSLVKDVLTRSTMSRLDAATYGGRENRRWLEHYGLDPERLFSAPYGPDAEYFTQEAERLGPERETLRAQFGFAPDDGPILLTVGRMAPAKQPEMLLEAFRRVRERHRCGLLFVGSGPLDDEMRARVERDAIPDVRFAGFVNQSEIPRAYAAADAFVLLSKHEPWGMVVAESMYFGLPLVLSDKVAANADLLGDGANGFLVQRDDLDGATQTIERLVTDAGLRQRLGEDSRRRIAQRSALDVATQGASDAIRHANERRLQRQRGRRGATSAR